MSLKVTTSALVLVMTIGVPVTAWAWGAPGCTNLPEYNRAKGALQGMTSACDMTVERARQVIAEHDGVPVAAPPQVASMPPVRYRRHLVWHRHKAVHVRRHAAR